MTPLARLLARRIATAGPMTVADYMAECLMHPVHGYYTTRDPFGAKGDFTTAPEISQIFGELMGLCLAQSWLDQGAPPSIILAELGPGRGTLMADALRATQGVPGFHAALSVHFVETSATLRRAQQARVPAATWHDDVATIPDGPLFLIANEFFDALPIRQFIRDGQGWRERVIGLEGERLVFGLTAAAPLGLLDHRLADTTTGDLVEVCPTLAPIAAAIGRRIATHGGAALIVDYGDWRSLGDTLQALSAHAMTDPLLAPGETDLTAHVDFESLALAAQPARPTRLAPQRVFLERLGIHARADVLARGLTGAAMESHLAACRRLTHPDEMGQLFRVMGLFRDQSLPPPGLET
jgi:NADH dehydrogenase [ubiquinone] 1 alpha subcomplex assembly factor 7